MKRIIILSIVALCLWPVDSFAGLVNVSYEGENLSAKNLSKIDMMLNHMSDFYSGFEVKETIDVTLKVFKTQDEGYAYMRGLYPNSTQYRKTTSSSYFGFGVAGVYMPATKTAAILGIEKGIDAGLKVIYHELSHHFTRLVFGRRNPPIWFNEGLAEYFEHLVYSKKKGWISEFPELDKGKLRTMIMLDELNVRNLLDMSHMEFMSRHRHEGQTYYSFSYAVVSVLLSELSDDAFRDFVGRMVRRPTDVKTSDILAAVFPGGFTAFESSIQKFIMNQ